MAGKVFFSVSMSLDGFIAPEEQDDPQAQRWMAQWMELSWAGDPPPFHGPFSWAGSTADICWVASTSGSMRRWKPRHS